MCIRDRVWTNLEPINQYGIRELQAMFSAMGFALIWRNLDEFGGRSASLFGESFCWQDARVDGGGPYGIE